MHNNFANNALTSGVLGASVTKWSVKGKPAVGNEIAAARTVRCDIKIL